MGQINERIAAPGTYRSDDSRTRLDDCLAALSGSVGDLATTLTGAKPSSKTGRHWRFGRHGSLAVVVQGAERGSWYDHEAGRGGDALGLVAHLRRCSMREAYAWAVSWLGISPAERRPLPRAVAPNGPAASGTLDLARQLWRESQPAADTLVAAYLASRGLTLPAGAPLRFHPACPRGAERLPAMLALMTDPATGQPCGVHRTFLQPDGGGKAPGQAKMMAGHAGLIRLVPDAEVGAALGVAEGIETALRVMQGFGWSPVWAATSAGGIARLPVLSGIEALTVFADGDPAGQRAAADCAERWQEAGREVTLCLAPPGEDFDDTARRLG
ncbi:toprim domain-containing protein [Roseomonas sp. KE0001]|uniref:DUF7146 domain-containing protein n=1 Tax=Roseomonas sp. KE0001 TaxID=2479201 RepID=UPI0018DF2387|nr:toprim domain-containing protein [Roseomonas sp. KE0001]MBI0432818.1 hypothetical protein [Roseomonas sp. KE0001]